MSKDISNNFVFNHNLLTQLTQKESPNYYIGVDTYDKNALAYCLTRRLDGKTEIILLKTMASEKEFKEEVENISKYFNAKVLKEDEYN